MVMSFFTQYKKYLKPVYILSAIIILGSGLRLWGLGSAEIFNDEGAYAFRAIGYLDFLSNEGQTTPVQWFRDGDLPIWTSLSLHDHPPLYFFTTHIFTLFFGDSLLALRLPSAIAGIISIYFIYLLMKKITRREDAGLLAAAILAVNHMHIWLSRSILMESLLILLIFITVYAFILFLEDRRYWIYFGLGLGLVALTKYTGVFMVPAFMIYALIFRRDIFASYHLYAAIGASMILFSPVIAYNIFLYLNVHHFDLQLAYLFGQNTPEWQASFGKMQYPFSAIGRTMLDMYSLLFILLSIIGLVYTTLKCKSEKRYLPLLFVLMAVFTTLVLVATGAAQRFIALYLVSFVGLIVIFAVFIFNKFLNEWWVEAAVAIFLIYELSFAVYGIFFIYPDFGVKKLDAFFDTAFQGKASPNVPESPNPHLDAVIKKYLLRLLPDKKSSIIIYDENLSLPTRLWLFTRRTFYHGVTSMSVRLFNNFTRSRGVDAVNGYDLYFVRATDNTTLNPYFSTADANDFEKFLSSELGLMPTEVITGYSDVEMFRVYKFNF